MLQRYGFFLKTTTSLPLLQRSQRRGEYEEGKNFFEEGKKNYLERKKFYLLNIIIFPQKQSFPPFIGKNQRKRSIFARQKIKSDFITSKIT
ncbi:MAG: hypothetical protein J6T94_11620 [Bacteroidaceae bacterium]|nr:hypothetical protein [Bacteroidaceae bacterium]